MYKQDKYDTIEALFTGVADLQLVEEQWDTIVRIAASLKLCLFEQLKSVFKLTSADL